MRSLIIEIHQYLLDNKPLGSPGRVNQFGISSRPLPLRAFNAPTDRRDIAYCLSACLITKRQNELFWRLCKLFSQSCTDVPAQLPSAMLPRQARGTCKKTVIQTAHFVSW